MSLTFFSPAKRPDGERARQQLVDEIGLLRAPPDPTLHGIVVAAARRLEAPMAAVTVIDCEQQWLAAHVGFPTSGMSRATSFCSHAILTPHEIMLVPDAAEDERFAGNPLVTDRPSLRFYVGVPLVMDGHQAIGALCVCDEVPRVLTAQQRDIVVDLAAEAVRAIHEIAASRI